MQTEAGALPVAVPEKIIGLAQFLDFFDRGHSLRQSTRYNVTFPASRKFHPYLGFSSPHKAGFAGAPSLPPAALPSLPNCATPGFVGIIHDRP